MKAALIAAVVAVVAAAIAIQPPPEKEWPPAWAELQNCPAVKSIEVIPAIGEPTKRIVHILDWHYVSRERFAVDFPGMEETAIDQEYARFLEDVARVQNAQFRILRWIAEREDSPAVYVEGIAGDESYLIRAVSRAAWRNANPLEDPPIGEMTRLQLMVGAAGRMYAADLLTSVTGVEDSEAHAAADPVGEDGELREVTADEKQAREDAIVRNLLDSDEETAVIILGGGHDLTEAIRRVADAGCEYVRVRPRR